MERNVEIDKISDGKRYGANDLVKVGCDDCRGCSACCHGMGDSIVTRPDGCLPPGEKAGKDDGRDFAGWERGASCRGRCYSATSEDDRAVRPVQLFKMKKAAAASTMHARASVGCFRWVGCMRMEHFLISFR